MVSGVEVRAARVLPVQIHVLMQHVLCTGHCNAAAGLGLLFLMKINCKATQYKETAMHCV